MQYLPAYRLKLYRNFKALEANDFHGIVRYYERYEDGIRSLDLDEYFDCTLAYTEALFETGNYGKHVVMCDHLVELIINENLENWGGDALFRNVLFKKAASLFRQGEYARAEHILRELIKIHPWDPLPQRFMRTCLLKQKPGWMALTRAAAVVLILLAALTIAVELFVVRPFFIDYYQKALVLHNALLIGGVLTFSGGEVWHYLTCRTCVQRLVGQTKRRKKLSKSAGEA